MEQLLGDAKRLVQRLNHHDNSVDILIAEVTNLQNKLIAMRQYRDEVSKLNDIADHRPRSTLILGSQLENQRIQNLKEENQELSISLAEHQSALELIMNKYREQVLSMMQPNSVQLELPKSTEQTIEMISMKERISEMARIMWQSAAIDDNAQIREIEIVRKLQVENENLRELLEISGGNPPSHRQPSPVNQRQTSQRDRPPVIQRDIPNSTKPSPLENNLTFQDKSDSEVDGGGSSTVSKEMYGDEDDGAKNDMPKSYSINKLKKKYNSRKNIFDNMQLPYNLDNFQNNADDTVPEKESIQKLKQLFNPPDLQNNNTTESSSIPLSSHSSSKADDEDIPIDPSENCFRAIISIKPMDSSVDMNDKLYDHDANENSDVTIRTEHDVTSAIVNEILSSTSPATDDQIIESAYERERMAIENEEKVESVEEKHDTTVTEVQFDGECVEYCDMDSREESDEGDTSYDDDDSFDESETSVIECLDSFDSMIEDLEASVESNENDDRIVDQDGGSESLIVEDEDVDVTSTKSDIHETSSNDEVRNRLNNSPLDDSNDNDDETTALEFLDDILDFGYDNDYDDENDDDYGDDNVSKDDDKVSKNDDNVIRNDDYIISKVVDNVSNNNTDIITNIDDNDSKNDAGNVAIIGDNVANIDGNVAIIDGNVAIIDGNVAIIDDNVTNIDDIVTKIYDNMVSKNDDSKNDDSEFPSENEDVKDNVNSPNSNDLLKKLSEDRNDCILSSDDLGSQIGDTSDTDSEVTYTEEDIDQALSDFDSFLDFNDSDGDNTDDELD